MFFGVRHLSKLLGHVRIQDRIVFLLTCGIFLSRLEWSFSDGLYGAWVASPLRDSMRAFVLL
jgi:hypothetical protein